MSDLGKILMLTGQGTLPPMEQHQCGGEELLQGFLAQYPALLAGDQINAEEPRRWLLIRELNKIRRAGISGDPLIERLQELVSPYRLTRLLEAQEVEERPEPTRIICSEALI